MTKVAIQEGVLRWALRRAGLTLDVLQKKFPKIELWVTGKSQPTLRQLETLAKATLTPLGFFFLAEPPEERLPVPHFRTLGDDLPSRPTPDLLETVQRMQQRQAWMREFLIDQGQEKLPFVRSARPEEAPDIVADRIRRMLGFGEGWAARHSTWTDALRALREAMEKSGILVVVNGIVGNNTHRKLNPNEFRGFVLADEYAPLMFINGADSKAAQMFTLAHELAHIFYGSSAAFDLREMQPASDPTEQACNRVAAEFLIQERELRRLWRSVQSDQHRFQTIARQFKVSEIVAARRALDVGLIRKDQFLEFYRSYQDSERRAAVRRPVGGDFYANQNQRLGRRFASAVIRSAQEGSLLYSEAYKLTGLYGNAFDRYAARLGFRMLQ
jgi:Zn-dependent peptidase ImmA (M78 family)